MTQRIVILPTDWQYGERLIPLARAASAQHELWRWLTEIALIVDDVAADERSWLGICDRTELNLYCHEDLFLRDSAASLTMRPASLPWELGERRDPDPVTPAAFSARKAERYLHHQFLAVKDILAGVVRPEEVPRKLAESYQEAWAVTVDGRLRRAAMPGH
ncbi:hypothetical protein KKG45_02585, partial [bacterium]|nr:hypothetical protein [bacterium]